MSHSCVVLTAAQNPITIPNGETFLQSCLEWWWGGGFLIRFLVCYLSYSTFPNPAAFLGARNRFLERVKPVSEWRNGDQSCQPGPGAPGRLILKVSPSPHPIFPLRLSHLHP